MNGFSVHLGTLDSIAARLSSSSDRLDTSADPPPPPQAGAVSDVVADAVGTLMQSMAGLVEGLAAVSGAVSSSAEQYLAQDENAGSKFSSLTFDD